MGAFLISAVYFVWGILKRFWILLPSLLLDPLDLYERFLHRPAPVNVPDWAFYLVFGLSVFLAAVMTHHEVRVKVGRGGAVYQELGNYLADLDKAFRRSVKSEEDLNAFSKDTEQILNETQAYIQKYVSPADATVFVSPGRGSALHYERAFSDKHNAILLRLEQYRENLKAIMQRLG